MAYAFRLSIAAPRPAPTVASWRTSTALASARRQYADVAFALDHMRSDLTADAAQRDVDTGLTNRKPAQDHLIQELGQDWSIKRDAPGFRLEAESEARAQQSERRGRCPCLRRTRNRVERRPLAPLARKTAEELRQPAQIDVDRCFEQPLKDSRRLLREPVAHEACGDHCIIVRPDRAVVIAHRVVANLSGRDGPDAPARKRDRTHQLLHDPP